MCKKRAVCPPALLWSRSYFEVQNKRYCHLACAYRGFPTVEGHFNPGLFNPKLQPQTFQPQTFQPWTFQPHGPKIYGWKVRGWKIHDWKVCGWSLGLKSLGYNVLQPSTFALILPMHASCHFKRTLNSEIGVRFWMFVVVFIFFSVTL